MAFSETDVIEDLKKFDIPTLISRVRMIRQCRAVRVKEINMQNQNKDVKIVVIGGTGLIGSKLVKNLNADGYDVMAASPASGVNTLTSEGLDEVLKGAQVVVDVSNSPSFDEGPATEFFKTSTTNVLNAEKAAGVKHHVALSVVGTDRLAGGGGIGGYFRAKLAQEKLISESSIPYSIVHATQFFEFVNKIADSATEGETVRPAPAFIQPMAADDVALAVGKVAVGAPSYSIVEIAGPEKYRLDELIRKSLTAQHDPRRVIEDPQGRYFGEQVQEHTLIPGDNASLGETRFDDWLRLATSRIAGTNEAKPSTITEIPAVERAAESGQNGTLL